MIVRVGREEVIVGGESECGGGGQGVAVEIFHVQGRLKIDRLKGVCVFV